MIKPRYGSLITQAAALLKFRTFDDDKLDAELCDAAISLRHCADALRELEAERDRLRAERDCQAQWADYYRARWLGETAVPKPDLPRTALEGKGDD